MWEPADKKGIPTEQDQFHARRAIAKLQMELSMAMDLLPASEAYVRWLLKEIEERWAWLAPVRRIPFEIFSLIFVMAAEKVWWSAACIAGVCRFWREVALATPQAWNYLDLRSKPPPEIALTYLQRSRRSLLHLTIPWAAKYWARYMFIASGVTHRIECLVISNSSVELLLEDYKNLTRLTIADHIPNISLDYLDVGRFPNLRYFDGAFYRPEIARGVDPCARFPRIEHLVVVTDPQLAWLDALRACAKTLVSLRITVGERGPSDPNPVIDLSRLRHLAVGQRWNSHRPWAFNAETPSLETYDLDIADKAYSVNVDVKTVTQLECSDVGSVNLYEYSSLRELRVIGYRYDALKFIDLLRRDYKLCPILERITVGSWDEKGLRQITRNLRRRNAATGVPLKVVSITDRERSWPGYIRVSVCLSMHD